MDRRRGLVPLLALAIFLLVGPSAAGQSGASSADPSEGYLFATGEVVGEGVLDSFTNESTTCNHAGTNDIEHHAMTWRPPEASSPARIDSSPSYFWTTCATFFVFEVDRGFTLTRDPIFSLYVECDHPIVGKPGVFQGAISIELWVNGTRVTEGPPSDRSDSARMPVCPWLGQQDAEPDYQDLAQVPLPIDHLTVDRGDPLRFEIHLWATDPAGKGLDYLVGSKEYPSAFHSTEIPGPLRGSLTSRLSAEVRGETAEAAPGNATTTTVKLVNTGAESREVRVNVATDSDWPAVVRPSNLTVPAEDNATLDVVVKAPGDSAEGVTATHRVEIRSSEPPIVFETLTTVAPGAGTSPPTALVEEDPTANLTPATTPAPGNGSSSVADTSDAGAGGTGTATSGLGLLSEFGVELLATAVTGGLAVLARWYGD